MKTMNQETLTTETFSDNTNHLTIRRRNRVKEEVEKGILTEREYLNKRVKAKRHKKDPTIGISKRKKYLMARDLRKVKRDYKLKKKELLTSYQNQLIALNLSFLPVIDEKLEQYKRLYTEEPKPIKILRKLVGTYMKKEKSEKYMKKVQHNLLTKINQVV